ncbi:P2X purinoceptor 7-like [Ptychodera flava]|uniref:P2X purinoceptor 7-like n=1 Tax=Ptychodera flava TaxID=63121 RepID=UPI00396A8FBC
MASEDPMSASFDMSGVDAALADVLENNSQEPKSCNCRGMCSRKRGHGACPCKAIDEYCNNRCTCGRRRPCVNIEPESSSEEDENTVQPEQSNIRKRRRVAYQPEQLSQVLDCMDEQDRHSAHERNVQQYIQNLTRERLEEVTMELIRRQPDAWADFVLDGTDHGFNQFHQQPSPDPKPDDIVSPPWCRCGECRPMPSQVENKCCAKRTGQECIARTWLFQQLVMDPNVLEIAMRTVADTYAQDQPRNNACYRHFAYRQFIYWQHGRLGRGNRRVIPSCCVLVIRRRYPSPNNVYVGYIEGEIQD